MQVTRTELTGTDQGTVYAKSVNGDIQGCLTVTANKKIVRSVDPGDTIIVTFVKEDPQ